MNRLSIAEQLVGEMERHALAAYPDECCGVLVGHRVVSSAQQRATVRLVIRARNAHTGLRTRRFAIAPEDLVRAHRQARRRGEQVIGYYHSHPDRPALPSNLDRRAAAPGVSHLILSVRRHRVMACRSWYLPAAGSDFEEERLGG